jgi:hypothetical protein
MLPSDKMFKFPVIMYDSHSAKAALRDEEKFEELGVDTEPQYIEYVIGMMCIPHDSILGWADSYRRETSIEECREQGFNCLEVMTKIEGAVLCPWKREEFEKHYNDHYQKIANYYIQSCENRLPPQQIRKSKSLVDRIISVFGGTI